MVFGFSDRRFFATVVLGSVVGVLTAASAGVAQDPGGLPESPRVTPLVRVIHNSERAVVSLFVPMEGQLVSGSGTIIHAAGFVLTNNHVLPKDDGLALIGADLPEQQRPERFRVVGRLPEKDLAIVKLLSNGPFPVVPLGRSDDVMNGEQVVVAGNPGGRGAVFTSGIISARNVLSGAPNALVMTNYRNSRRDTYIQFDAASNGGNSGGGLINMEGNLIGVVWGGIRQEQNVGYAIPADVVHQLAEEIVEPELQSRRAVGVTLKPETIGLMVNEVVDESAAEAAGIQAGDELISVNGESLRNRVDWNLALYRLLPTGHPLRVGLKRGGERHEVEIRSKELQPTQPTLTDAESLKPGLRCRFYHGRYSLLPNFADLTPERETIVGTVNLSEIRQDRTDEFAVELTGYLRVTQPGLHRITVLSDDGSKLFLNDREIIDNDGNHHPQPRSRLVYAAPGLHQLRLLYFEGNGFEELQLLLQTPDGKQQPVTAELLWHKPE
ncbi:MAG: trypsin-like peptidase domain-containing protein [Planctomycetaceae bacterium]|nr:trypsin-like peptidase domain-containing protein [Planctomycetaceae bacterium]